MIELVKNSLQLLSTSTGGIGELANFAMGASYVFAAGFIYRLQDKKGSMDFMYHCKRCYGNDICNNELFCSPADV